MLNANETYIGPIFDESAIQFFLVFNRDLKVFHYVLNEGVPVPDAFAATQVSSHITIGRRTGFAFYKDRTKDRKILVGAFAGNTRLNNYLDGPFDQLPDNFLQGGTLRDAILKIVPDYAGRIDRFGSLPDGSERYAIGPYIYYDDEQDLAIFDKCIDDTTRPAEQYYACFDMEEYQPDGGRSPQKAAKEPDAMRWPGGAHDETNKP